MLTQRDLAKYVVARGAHYHFNVKGNQPTLQDDIRLLFARRGRAHYTETSAAEHGRIETRRIWCSSRLNDYLDFPHVGQVFLIEREVICKKSGHHRSEVALGVTSRTANQATAADLLLSHPHRLRPRKHLAPAALRHQPAQPARPAR